MSVDVSTRSVGDFRKGCLKCVSDDATFRSKVIFLEVMFALCRRARLEVQGLMFTTFGEQEGALIGAMSRKAVSFESNSGKDEYVRAYVSNEEWLRGLLVFTTSAFCAGNRHAPEALQVGASPPVNTSVVNIFVVETARLQNHSFCKELRVHTPSLGRGQVSRSGS